MLFKSSNIMGSSVRRILKRGGRNFRKFERNIDQNIKLSHLNFVPFFAQNQVKSKKKKKKGLHSNFVPFSTQNQVNRKKKGLHSSFVPFSAQNQVNRKKKGLHSSFVPFFAQNQVKSEKKRSSIAFSPSSSPKPGRNARNIPFVQSNQRGGGGPCLNFAHFSMQFCNPGDPKGGPWPNAPPLNTPLIMGVTKLIVYCHVRRVLSLFSLSKNHAYGMH